MEPEYTARAAVRIRVFPLTFHWLSKTPWSPYRITPSQCAQLVCHSRRELSFSGPKQLSFFFFFSSSSHSSPLPWSFSHKIPSLPYLLLSPLLICPPLKFIWILFFSSILNRVLVCVSAWWREGLLAFFKLFTGRDVASPHTERTPCAIKGSKGTVYRGCNARKPLFHHWIVEQQRQIEAIFTGILNGATGGNTLESLPSSLPLSLRPPSSLSLSPTHTNTHSLCSKGLYLKRHLKLTLTLRTECYFLRRF